MGLGEDCIRQRVSKFVVKCCQQKFGDVLARQLQVVLLDFGATRAVPPATACTYRRLIEAGLAHDRDRIRELAVETGLLGAAAVDAHRPSIDRIIAAIDDAMSRPGPFDFGDRAFVPVVREEASSLLRDRQTWHVPDVETLFVQRKVSGTALLAARLRARVDVVNVATAAISNHPAAYENPKC